MSLSFQETMSGTADTPDGRRHFHFTVTAASPTALALVGWAPLALAGTATFEGVVTDAPLLPGSMLEIGPPLHRFLRYQVHFRDAAGDVYRFFGQKTVYLTRLPRTMSTLEGRVYRNGDDLGAATLRFDFKDLVPFLGSFRLAAAA
jgi:hypothetical protein